MREPLSTQEISGSDRFQKDDEISEELAHDISYQEILQCCRHQYERQDAVAPKPVQMAEISWADAMTTADRLKHASDLAFLLEANRRGYAIAGKLLSGKYYENGVKKHKRRNKSQKQG